MERGKEQLDLRVHELPWDEPVLLADVLAGVSCPIRLVLGELSGGSLVDDAAVDQREKFVKAFRSAR